MVQIIIEMKSNLYLIRSGIFGVCIGDALGLPVQFKDRNYLKNSPITKMVATSSLNIPKGTWSDDSALTLCLAESLSRGYNLDDIAKNFLKWFKNGFLTPDDNAFDIGRTTQISMEKLEKGVLPNESGGKSIKENGNGSLMRILPLSFYIERNEINKEIYYEMIKDVSSITHRHIYSILSCIIYIDIAVELIRGNSIKNAYLKICNNKNNYFKYLSLKEKDAFIRILSGEINLLQENDILSTGYVIDSLEAALWCLLNSRNYMDTVLKAVNLGGDTDTIAAIAGGLAGINYGFESIPIEWLSDLRKVELIEDVCRKLNTKY
jgi:ADP-ribosyl-[dinitrogen reductase] hydrolase